jgi:hypothetical protein
LSLLGHKEFSKPGGFVSRLCSRRQYSERDEEEIASEEKNMFEMCSSTDFSVP